MINTVISLKLDNQTDEIRKKLETAHLTTIRELDLSELSHYADENIATYVENIVLQLKENTKESEQTVIDLLNNDDIDFELCLRIIAKEDVKISPINKVNDQDLWGELLKNDRIISNWSNLLHYYQYAAEIDDKLLTYLNNENHYKNLSATKINDSEGFEEESFEKFSLEILLSNGIDDVVYSYLVRSIFYEEYPRLDISVLSPKKIDILLQQKKLALTQENIDELEELGTNKHINLIENFIDDFLQKKDGFYISFNTYIALINSSNISADKKIDVINNIDVDIINRNKDLLDVIYKFNLLDAYQLQSNIRELLIYANRDNFYDRVKLLTNQIKYLDRAEISKYLQEYGKPYAVIAESGKRPTIKNKKVNKNLLEALKSCGYISRVFTLFYMT